MAADGHPGYRPVQARRRDVVGIARLVRGDDTVVEWSSNVSLFAFSALQWAHVTALYERTIEGDMQHTISRDVIVSTQRMGTG